MSGGTKDNLMKSQEAKLQKVELEQPEREINKINVLKTTIPIYNHSALKTCPWLIT